MRLQERLSPAHLKEQVKGQVKEQYEQAKETVREATIGKVEDMVERVSDTVSETRRGIVDAIKEKPIPAALVGVGLAWMWMNGRGDSRSDMVRYGDRYRGGRLYDQGQRGYASPETSGFARQSGTGVWDRTTDAAGNLASNGDTVSGVAGQVQETASNIAAKRRTVGAVDQAQETAGYLADQAQNQARRVEDQLQGCDARKPAGSRRGSPGAGAAAGSPSPRPRRKTSDGRSS